MRAKQVVLLGSTSFTGSHILHQLNTVYSFIRVARHADVADYQFTASEESWGKLKSIVSRADVVINCMSDGDVDHCELNPEAARCVNIDLLHKLCQLQEEHKFHLIHFSSNAVYDGEHPLYVESSPHKPVNTYGQQKSEADCYLREFSPSCTILRPITMYGELLGNQRHNPFSFFLGKLEANEPVVCVDDVYVNMLFVNDLVGVVQCVIDKGIYGEFNLSGDDVVNRYEFVSAIKACLPACESVVTRTDSTQFKTAAMRPRNTSFDNSLMKSTLSVFPQPLAATLNELVQRSQRNHLSQASPIAA